MTTASELIARSLRLINQPGRGADLAPEDLANAFSALQEILDSKAVTRQFVPGIRRHFFTLTGKSTYSYGAGGGYDLNSGDFGLANAEPAPISIEGDAAIRNGGSITNNELVGEYRFWNTGAWSVGAGASIADNQYTASLAVTSSTHVVAPVAGSTYTLRVRCEVAAGGIEVRLRNSGVAFFTSRMTETGYYETDVVWPAGASPDVQIATTAATDDASLTLCSLVLRGHERLELVDAGTDWRVRPMDQAQYNAMGQKGGGGIPSRFLYSRRAGQVGELKLDAVGASGILVMDVRVNTVQVTSIDDELVINPEAIRWLRYFLADTMAPEYGKTLSARAQQQMAEAWSDMAAANYRTNLLRTDPALRGRSVRFNIDQG